LGSGAKRGWSPEVEQGKMEVSFLPSFEIHRNEVEAEDLPPPGKAGDERIFPVRSRGDGGDSRAKPEEEYALASQAVSIHR
jgi:hypothetical protein